MVPLPPCTGHGGGIGTAQLDWFNAATDIDEVRKPPLSRVESLTKLGGIDGYFPTGPCAAKSNWVTCPFS